MEILTFYKNAKELQAANIARWSIERDIYRKALKKIADMPLTQSWQQHFYEAVKIAQDVLQEGRDE